MAHTLSNTHAAGFETDAREPWQARLIPSASQNVVIIGAAIALIEKMIAAPAALVAERVSLLKVLRALYRVPATPEDIYVAATLLREPSSCNFDGKVCRVHRGWEVTVEQNQLAVVSTGVISVPGVGSDAFECMRWEWNPTLEEKFDFVDRHGSFRLLPKICAFEDEVADLDLAQPGLVIDVTDPENPALPEVKRLPWQH